MTAEKMYETAFALKESRLWKLLAPDTLFAVHLSSGKTLYCTVESAGGPRGTALVAWPESGGLDAYRSQDPLAADCLVCRFDSLLTLQEEELTAVTACADRLKLSLRGANPCPRFLRCLPYRAPAVLTDHGELSLLGEAMRAALYVAEMLKNHGAANLGFLPCCSEDGVMIPCVDAYGKGFNWWQVILPPRTPLHCDPVLFTDRAAAVRLFKRRKRGQLACALVHLPASLPDAQGDLCYPAVLIAFLHENGAVRSFATQPRPDDEALPEALLNELASQLTALSVTPAEVLVSDPQTEALLIDFCSRCGLRLTRTESIDALPGAVSALTAMVRRGKLG